MDISRLPIGIQTFEDIRNKDMIYVDKTALVYELANGVKYNFLSRPRRFGKSLLISTLEAYFQGKKHLFNGLDIENLETEWREYPVLHFDLNNGMYQDENGTNEALALQLSRLEQRYGIDNSSMNVAARFSLLIETVSKLTKSQVVILVDEYEKPLLETINNPGLQEKYRAILKPFYATLKSSDQYVRFVMLTGVTRIGHLSVFSDLNNVVNHSLDPKFSSICGFTKQQLAENFDEYISSLAVSMDIDKDEALEKLRIAYDGYQFSREDVKVFNPYSILQAMRAQDISDYWFETGTPSFLIEAIRAQRFKLQELEDVSVKDKHLTEIDENYTNAIPLLYQSGYLTIKSYNAETRRYTLGMPNQEVKQGFYESLAPNYLSMSEVEVINYIDDLTDAVNEGKVDEMMEIIRQMISSIPSSPREVYEYLYRDSVYLIFKVLGFDVRSEVSILSGRVDCAIQTHKYDYIIEFKINETAEIALEQIESKDYASAFTTPHKKLFKVGVNFDLSTHKMTWSYK